MKDLTRDNPAKVIFFYTIPLIVGNILQQIYNVTDSKIVSMYIDSNALAAVGNTSVVSNLVMGFIMGLTQGYAILVARSYGAGDERMVRRYSGGCFVLTGAFTAGIMLVSILTVKPVLLLLDTPKELVADCVSYLTIILWGMIFIGLYNACANILRAVGDSKHPLYFLILSIVCNVGLDILFVGPLHMGINGAAYATVIAQAICAFAALFYMWIKTRSLFPHRDEWKPDRDEYGKLLPIGFSMAFMSSIVNVGTVIMQWAINSLGTVYVTAQIAARRITSILMCCIYSFGFSMTNYVSQNMGAGKFDRVRKGIFQCNVMVTIISVFLCAISHAFGDELVQWIVSSDDMAIITPATQNVKIAVVFFYVLGPLFVFRCALQGMGKKSIPIISSVLELATKAVFAFALVPVMGYFGIILTEPMSWVIMTIVLAISYIVTVRKGIENVRI